ncbi:alpha/beta hydrolase-fold protein [Sphaerisporangium sp. B11E5]|uniref:alpha/beta hydrolase n=1 Tax=Sphaerisporangium sp. B11E5 TaxID=3153563 RepID=UPI00325DB519
MKTLTETWWSDAIGRRKSVTVALPPGYSPDGPPFPVLYLLHPYGGDRRSWLRCQDLASHVAMGQIILVLPESGRYWLINDAGGRRYEDYLVDEVVRYVDRHFNTFAHRGGRAIAGFSMGGACALFQALRHGDLFSVAASNSGAFEAPLRVGDPYARYRDDTRLMMPTTRDHERVWGPPGSATRETYDPYRLLAARDRGLPLSVYLDVGLDDYDRVISMNRNMRDALSAHSVPHEYRERRGGHDWEFVAAGLGTLFGFVRDHLTWP